MQSKDFILKDNSEEIREKIKAAGIHVCGCAWFKDACWLWYSTELLRSVHGIKAKNQEEELKWFLNNVPNLVICADVDDFIAHIKQSQDEQ